MRILVDARPTLGGLQRYTVELCRLLASDPALELSLTCFGAGGGWGQRINGAGTTSPWPVISSLRRLVTEQCLLPLAVSRSRSDILHVPRGFLPGLSGARTVVSCPDLWPIDGFCARPAGWTRWYDRTNLRRALQRADHVIAISRHTARALENRCGIPPDRVTVIAPPLAVLPRVAPPAEPPAPFLLTVGTIEPRKNLDRLLDAQALAFPKTGLPLWVVGAYGWRSRSVARRLRHESAAVRWLGPVDDTRLAELYATATAVVQYSLEEGFDYPVAEALSLGAPVVLSDIPVHREVALDHALFADPGDPSELAARLADVAGWSVERRRAHAAAGRQIVEDLRRAGSLARYLTVYRNVLEHAAPRP